MRSVIGRIKAEALINLKAANAGIVVAFVIKESTLNHAFGVFYGGEITRTKTAIDLNEGFALPGSGIFVQSRLNVADWAVVYVFESIDDFGLLAHAEGS